MSEMLQEFVRSSQACLQVDRAAGILRGVKLLGLRSRNGRRYRDDALRAAVALYEGAKVNVNHPKGHPLSPRDYQDRLGVIHGVRYRVGEGLFGDLHFNPKHPLSEQLVWDAEHAPSNVGLSHNVLARTSGSGAETCVEEITKVQSIDLVADPATTDGLFEHTAQAEQPSGSDRNAHGCEASAPAALPNFDALTLAALEHDRPDLVRELARGYESQLAELRAQLEAAAAREAGAKRRAQIATLLQEHDLPQPSSSDVVDSWVVGPRFLESLMKAESDEQVRAMIAERAELVRMAHTWAERRPRAASRPRSRDQSIAEQRRSTAASAADFAAALRAR